MIALFAEAPALPLHTAGPYVAAAYIVFVLILLIYVGIMATRLTRNQRELAELRRQVEERELDDSHTTPSLLADDENENQIHSHFDFGEGSGVDVGVADQESGAG
jgi:HAMP domain-containing protein